jgi:hypothetical protein
MGIRRSLLSRFRGYLPTVKITNPRSRDLCLLEFYRSYNFSFIFRSLLEWSPLRNTLEASAELAAIHKWTGVSIACLIYVHFLSSRPFYEYCMLEIPILFYQLLRVSRSFNRCYYTLICLNLFQHVWVYFSMSQYTLLYRNWCQRASAYLRVFLHFFAFLYMVKHASMCLSLFQRVLIHFQIIQDVPIFFNIFQYFWIFLSIFWHVLTYHDIVSWISLCLVMFHYVSLYFNIFQYVLIHFYLFSCAWVSFDTFKMLQGFRAWWNRLNKVLCYSSIRVGLKILISSDFCFSTSSQLAGHCLLISMDNVCRGVMAEGLWSSLLQWLSRQTLSVTTQFRHNHESIHQ